MEEESPLPEVNGSDWNLGTDFNEEVLPHSFEYSILPSLVNSVNEVTGWVQEPCPLKAPRKYYPDLKMALPTFPLMFETLKIIEEEWTKTELAY